MMNDCRKSDRLVVPKKSSNKPDNIGAEEMEGRRLPKKQQNMFRTLRRESVLNKLQPIHQRAKADNMSQIPRTNDLVLLSEGRRMH